MDITVLKDSKLFLSQSTSAYLHIFIENKSLCLKMPYLDKLCIIFLLPAKWLNPCIEQKLKLDLTVKLGEILSPGENGDINIALIAVPGLLSTTGLVIEPSK